MAQNQRKISSVNKLAAMIVITQISWRPMRPTMG